MIDIGFWDSNISYRSDVLRLRTRFYFPAQRKSVHEMNGFLEDWSILQVVVQERKRLESINTYFLMHFNSSHQVSICLSIRMTPYEESIILSAMAMLLFVDIIFQGLHKCNLSIVVYRALPALFFYFFSI